MPRAMRSIRAATPRAKAAPTWNDGFVKRVPVSMLVCVPPAAAVRWLLPMPNWSSRTKTSRSEHTPAAESPPPKSGADPVALTAVERRHDADRRRPVRIRSPHDETPLEAAGDFARRVWKKADKDQIFFMAGAIAFNVMVAIVPLILATLGIAGQILQNRVPHPEEVLLSYITAAIPEVSADFQNMVRSILSTLLEQSSSFTLIGGLLLVWV